MQEFKTIIGIVAIILTFIGYVPYLRDVIKGKTIPHVYSWFLWGFVTLIAFAIQVSTGGGIGAFVTLTAAVMCVVVFTLGIKNKAKRQITKIDTLFFILALVALGFWLIARQPVISAILATGIDLLGYAPTVRKSWNKPHSETLSFYFLNTIRFGLAVISLQTYSITTALYPVVWIFGNGIFALILLIRRQQIRKTRKAV